MSTIQDNGFSKDSATGALTVRGDGTNAIPITGSIAATATTIRPATATLANVASATTSATILAGNSNRLGASVFNDSTAVLYLKFGTTASSSSYTVQVAANGYYELPDPCYTGRIDGIWAAANGNARVTELTA